MPHAKSIARFDAIVKLLADGRFHSGTAIAETLGISRATVWKQLQKLTDWEIPLYSVRGKGYKIPGGIELLDQHYLKASIKGIDHVQVLTTTDSTADVVTEHWRKHPGQSIICIAEHQAKGRGRKGRPWISPFAANLYFSLGIELPLGLSALGGISLAVGLGLSEAFNQYTKQPVKVKWPNDLLVNDRKLAGILVEASGDSSDTSFLNIGIGINWHMQPRLARQIDQPWANLKEIIQPGISRNQILVESINRLIDILDNYQTQSAESLLAKWPQISAYYGQKVSVVRHNDTVIGKEKGISKNGALRIETEKGEVIIHSGEVSLRRAAR